MLRFVHLLIYTNLSQQHTTIVHFKLVKTRLEFKLGQAFTFSMLTAALHWVKINIFKQQFNSYRQTK